MKVTNQDGIYKASRITGPKHNYLGLKMSATPPTNTSVVPRRINDELAGIDEEQLVAAVIRGIEDANRIIAKPLYPQLIEYVPSDTPDYAAYTQLSKAIVEAASAECISQDD